MASYPSAFWGGNTRGSNLNDSQTHTTWHDEAMAEIIAMQAELGLLPKGSQASVRARLDLYDQALRTWTTGTVTGLTKGAGGTEVAFYFKLGKFVRWYWRFILGSGSAITGDLALTLPTTGLNASMEGSGYVVDASPSARYNLIALGLGTSSINIRLEDVDASFGQEGIISATVPFTWASGDSLVLNGSYLEA